MAENLVGRMVHDQYRVDSIIPSRGVGSVYKVWDEWNDAHLVMRVMTVSFEGSPSIYHQVVRKANTLSELSHPNILPFSGLYKGEDFSFTLEKYVEGSTLEQILVKKGGWLPIEDALSITKAISNALTIARSRGVLHGSLAPKNVIISEDGHISLTGFIQTSQRTGTEAPIYAAPEVLRGERPTLSSDAYSMGVLLVEMMTGARLAASEENEPNVHKIAEQIRRAQFTAPPPNPHFPISEISDDLATVLVKALDKTPAYRYQSANEFFLAVCKAIRIFANEIPEQIWGALPVTGAVPVAYNLPDNLDEAPGGWLSRLRLPYLPILPTTASILSAVIVVLLIGGYIFYPELFNLEQTPELLPGYAYIESGQVINTIPGGVVRQLGKGANIPFGQGSIITVGENMVSLILPGNYRLKIAGNPVTRLELMQAWSDQSTVTVLKLYEGSLFLISTDLSDENRPIYIQTVSGQSALRANGSIMGNLYDSSTQTFGVDCVTGKCRLESEYVVDLQMGQRSQVDSGGIPIPPSPFNLNFYKGYNFSFIPPDSLGLNTQTPNAVIETPTPRPTIELSPTPIPPTWTPIPTVIPNTGYGR